MRDRLGSRMGMISPGIRAITACGGGMAGVRVGGGRRDLCRQVGAGRMADQRKSRRVGPDMPDSVMKDREGVANRRLGVGKKILGHRTHVVLVARKDHDPCHRERGGRSRPHKTQD